VFNDLEEARRCQWQDCDREEENIDLRSIAMLLILISTYGELVSLL